MFPIQLAKICQDNNPLSETAQHAYQLIIPQHFQLVKPSGPQLIQLTLGVLEISPGLGNSTHGTMLL